MAVFKEISRIKVTDARDIVASEVIDDEGDVTGININSFVKTGKYTGFTKGVFVPVDMVEDFKEFVQDIK